ncbi:BZ3500_MvSof-1268-A1-R1_Chr2-1g04156 [Microbotryum saponariae]|uniref:BZ3500_MvSof-1268-A1-R1_Chr2-1g04156 protein n=1 Tax=Microbotryum saponariae TaxID=289078 RepID=A0A2X0M1Q2_9BASI|nr:BZ3500_MvSof-1268-A1-R1_Chr2-1g04156 [Microbotryum saponariae]SCZ91143.1 BZ3501_MvSof-1269-A2-R1_Chr2-1g03812 [Microbotryum saponariae]
MRARVTLPLCHILLSCCASATPSWEPPLTYQIPPPERIAELAQPYLINPEDYSKTVYYRHGPRDDVSSYVMYAFQSMTDTAKWASAVVRHTYGHPKKDSNFEPTTTDIALSLEHMVPTLKPEGEGQRSEVEYVKNRNFYQKVFLWNQPRSAVSGPSDCCDVELCCVSSPVSERSSQVLGLEEKLQLGTLIELGQIDRTTQPVLREYSEDMAQELGEGCP